MRNQNLIKLAELILQRREELMQVWLNKVGRRPEGGSSDTPEAASHVAAVLRDVAAALVKGKKKPIADLPMERAPEIHGIQRLNEGFDLIEVVADYSALREAVQEFAETKGIHVTGRVRTIVDRVLDKAIGVAVQTYSEQKALEIQRHREEHLSFIVHDLKTPLSAVSTAAVILDRTLCPECKSEPVARMLSIVERNAKRLNGLISRVIGDQIKLQHAESVLAARIEKRIFDLWPLVQELIHDLEPLTKPQRTTIRNNVPPDCSVFADPVLIAQVFQNLLSNAIKYTSDGEVTIGAQAHEHERTVQCWVRDAGQGIPEDRIGKVFDKLETDPEKKGGFGLGLAIVKQVVEAHGGRIIVTSKMGEGSTFEFFLPWQDESASETKIGKGAAA